MANKLAIWYVKTKRNPVSSLPMKGLRLVRRKVLLRVRGKYLKAFPLHISSSKFLKHLKLPRKDTINSFNEFHKDDWFFSKGGVKGILKIYNDFPDEKKKVIEAADRICDHKFELLGSGLVSLGNRINWHRDFKSGKVWPLQHYSGLNFENVKDASDVKVPWDLSRFHHLSVLGQAYLLTNDEQYASEFKLQVEDWFSSNPVEFGVNWACSMEAAIRVINLIFAYYFFRDSPILDDHFWLNYLKQLFLHGRFIRNNLEWNIATENHYLSDILGLFFLGLFFRRSSEGKDWLRFSRNELENEIKKQVGDDGVQYEAAINYHRLVTEMLTLAYLLGRKNKVSFSQGFMNKLEKMFEFIQYYTKPNGLAPVIGDMDDGRIVNFWNPEMNDHRDLLALGSIIFKRKEFYGLFHLSLLWLGGLDRYPGFGSKGEPLHSMEFNDSGFYVLRHNDDYLIVRCGSIGRKGFGGHGHNDQLSFELNMDGNDLIIDPGSYVYTADTKARHLFRSTAYHNTLFVDGKEMNNINWYAPFNMENNTRAKCLVWEINKWKDYFVGEHFGYIPLEHRRSISFDKEERLFEITDKLFEDYNPHDVVLNLHLAPGVKANIKDNEVVLNRRYRLRWEGFDKPKLKQGFVSPSYGVKIEASILEFKKLKSTKEEFKISIQPISS